ncbi:MAG TPA: cupin domain-containing protein [Spirochaetia bacterium]|nr:cupin domain-containing protein [Spirochaetia bacterium]
MDVIDVSSLGSSVPDKHFKLHARQISASAGLTVSYNFMEPDGGAEMHTHEDRDHVFYVLEGEMKVFDGIVEQLVPCGSALVVKAGEAHQVTGTGKMPCVYLLVTSSGNRAGQGVKRPWEDRRSEAW